MVGLIYKYDPRYTARTRRSGFTLGNFKAWTQCVEWDDMLGVRKGLLEKVFLAKNAYCVSLIFCLEEPCLSL